MFSVLLSHIPLLVLVSSLFITYVNSRPQQFSGVADFGIQFKSFIVKYYVLFTVYEGLLIQFN